MKLMQRFAIVAALIVLLLVGTSSVSARRANDPAILPTGYEITWYTIDGGGATVSTGGGYSLGGTIGQPDAGALTGGAYALNGGFWAGAASNHSVYLPLTVNH